ncbi:hypothetical protein SAMN05660485_01042 [Blastococcus fimeti]|nr:hypothetical protein SAMN05660485_01042 [Blastococcus fimeti]
MSEPVGVHVACLTVDCVDAERLAAFWRALLDYEIRESFTRSIRIGPSSGRGVDLLFAPGARPKAAGKNRLHLDLRPADRQAAVDRALLLGAELVSWSNPTGPWTVLADPEGNEFCILQSEADHALFIERFRAAPPT